MLQEQIGDQQIPQRRGRNDRRNHNDRTYTDRHQAQQRAQALEEPPMPRNTSKLFGARRYFDCDAISERRAASTPVTRRRQLRQEHRLVSNRQTITAERKSNAGENPRASENKEGASYGTSLSYPAAK